MLCEMGFSQSLARRALDRTRWDVESAAEWCIAHCEEDNAVADNSNAAGVNVGADEGDGPSSGGEAFVIPDFDDNETGKNDTLEFEQIKFGRIKITYTEEEFESRRREYEAYEPDEESIHQLEFLGIGHALARKALRICRGDIERSADWAFNNWNSPTEDDSPEKDLLEQTQHVRNQISDLQREGEEIMKQMAKEKANPTTDFVTEMVERLEGRKSKPMAMSKPQPVRGRGNRRLNASPHAERPLVTGSPTTQALHDLMADLGGSPAGFMSPPRSLPQMQTPPTRPFVTSLLPTQNLMLDDSDFNPTSDVSLADELINENNCMVDTTDYATTDYDTDFIVTDNMTDLTEDMTEAEDPLESIELEQVDEEPEVDNLLHELQAVPSDNQSMIDQLINESVQQIDKQIEMNVAASSIENLKMASSIESSEKERFETIRVSDQGIPDLSIISEEQSRIPTDFCTSPEGSFKSECDSNADSIMTDSIVSLKGRVIIIKIIIIKNIQCDAA